MFALLLVIIAGALLFSARALANEDAPTGYTHSALGTAVRVPRELAPEPGVSGQNVQGVDERVQVVDTTVPNLRTVVFLELYDGFNDLIGTCSGTIIGPDAVLTAAHCLYSAADGWVQDIAVVPAKNGNLEPYGFQLASDWWVPDQWIDEDEHPDYDWGIIKMPDSQLSNMVGWRALGSLATDTLLGDEILPAIVGYPGDKPEGTMWLGFKPWFDFVGDTWLEYTIDTAGGMSGSAIIALGPNPNTQGYIIGIHNLGGPEVNSGVRIRPELINDLDIGCQLMDCVFYFYVEEEPPTPTPTRTPTATPTATPTSTGPGITVANWKFCNTPFVCASNQRIGVGEDVEAQFTLSGVPTGQVEIDVTYNGNLQTFTYSPPYVGPGFVTGDAIPNLPVQGTILIEVYVNGFYAGEFSTVVKAPLIYRMFSWGLSAP